ncbi:succinoglycan biosynthesis protein [Kaistia sp. 32K]|uniref:thermonuclease family protein n=1 Tax=Kaistia sp. 32K TaxID=2795690 RepID=UPI001916C84F|nr:thermonuclease family protein [Kaistia sp. 32K]BCP53475.1 succinoglycan biosynthesis protein [Kaistia sp. 32K]
MIRPRPRRGRKAPPLIFLFLLIAGLLAIGYVDQHLREIRASDGTRVVVRDGDSLAFGGKEFRLAGIDAPELHQTCEDAAGKPWRCGEAARKALRELVAQGELSCSPRANDRYGRAVATCRVKDVGDIGEVLVRQGLAINFAGRGEGDYAAPESAARLARRGLWQGRFIDPAEWRRQHPRPDAF